MPGHQRGALFHDAAYLLERPVPLPARRLAVAPGVLVFIILAMAAMVAAPWLGPVRHWGRMKLIRFLTATLLRAASFLSLHRDTNLPLYFLILKGWIAIFGTSLAAMRMLSAILGVAAVGPGWRGCLKQCGASWRTTIWALALAAFAPVQFHYGA